MDDIKKILIGHCKIILRMDCLKTALRMDLRKVSIRLRDVVLSPGCFYVRDKE